MFKKHGDYKQILNMLVSLGFILSYQEFPKLLFIKLKSYTRTYQSKAFISIKKVKNIQRKNIISAKELIKLQRREGGAAYYILTTDKGLVTSFDAINIHVGGRILFKIM